MSKCMTAMLYGTEACPVMSRHKHSLNCVVTRVFMKILCTGSKQIVEESQKYFVFLPVSHRIDICTARFLDRFSTPENSLRNVFHDQARRHMNELSVKFDITEVMMHGMMHGFSKQLRTIGNSSASCWHWAYLASRDLYICKPITRICVCLSECVFV